MKSRGYRVRASVLTIVLVVLGGAGWARAQQGAPVRSSGTTQVNSYGLLPLSFEANDGQTDPRVQFLSRGSHHTLFLTPGEAVLVLSDVSGDQGTIRRNPTETAEPRKTETQKAKLQTVLSMKFAQANQARISGIEELPGKVNYFIGNDPKQWHSNLPTYAKVQYKELYPGIDLIYHGNQGQLEYDFIVHPGADSGKITLELRGTEKLEIDGDGDLLLHTSVGIICQRRPAIYQEVNGSRQEVSGGYVLKDNHRVGFQIGTYERGRPLVIDPLIYSTYLGGSSSDFGSGIAVDAAGNAYVTGYTSSTNFPTTPSAFQTAFVGGFDDVFVTKLNPVGTALLYSTYLGGSGIDVGSGVAVDTGGNAYVTGYTSSTDFPTTPGAFQTAFAGGFDDAFVTKLNAAGTALLYSTYLGGSSEDDGLAIGVDAGGNAYVTGHTSSTNFPTTPGAFQTAFGGLTDAFVTKLNAAGTALLYSTYLGGSSEDDGFAIAVDAAGNAYLTGRTLTDFPTTPGAFQTAPAGSSDAFVTKLNAAGTALLYSTYLGGSSLDEGHGIAVDATGNAYVTGFTTSTNLPTTPGAFQTLYGGSFDAFGTKLNPAGTALLYSTYLGGSSLDEGHGIAVDAAGNAYVVTGFTTSTNFARTPGAFQTANAGSSNAFVTKIANPFTDDPLIAHSSVVRAVHITELRLRIDALRARYQLSAFSYTNPTITAGVSVIQAKDITELRAALSDVYTKAGMPPPTYSTSPGIGVTVFATDISEIRAAVTAVE